MRTLLPCLAASFLALAALGCAGRDVAGGRDAYVSANERLLASLPRYPGAEEVERTSSPYFRPDDEHDPLPQGYTTNVVYELPARVPQRRVIDFYRGELSSWRSRVEYTPGVDVQTGDERPGAWGASFTRSAAAVGVNTDNLIRGRRFELSVDHRGAR